MPQDAVGRLASSSSLSVTPRTSLIHSKQASTFSRRLLQRLGSVDDLSASVTCFGTDPLERDAMVSYLFNEIDLDRDGVLVAKELHDACSKPEVRCALRSL